MNRRMERLYADLEVQCTCSDHSSRDYIERWVRATVNSLCSSLRLGESARKTRLTFQSELDVDSTSRWIVCDALWNRLEVYILVSQEELELTISSVATTFCVLLGQLILFFGVGSSQLVIMVSSDFTISVDLSRLLD